MLPPIILDPKENTDILDMTVEDKNYIKILQGKDASIWHEKIKLQTGIDLNEYVLTA